MFKKVSKALTIGAMFLVLATAALAAPAPQDDQTIVDIAVADEQFSTLVTALQAAELVETLSGPGPFTVFAPTNAAFDALPEGTLDGLLADTEALRSVLLYHVVRGNVLAADVVQLESATMVQGGDVSIMAMDDGTVMINDATVTTVDIEGSNGVIHVIDTVLLPPSDEEMMAEEAAPAEEEATAQATGNTVVDIAVADEATFGTLVAALQAAELVETLSGPGPFTVFAPTNDAFAALPEGALDDLLADIPALTNVLLYHVVDGTVLAADVVNLTSATSLLGQSLAVTVMDDGTVMINDATVIQTDVEASNGVIHVIDTVLLPESGAAASTDATAGGEAGPGTAEGCVEDYTVVAGDSISLVAEQYFGDVLAYTTIVAATNAAAVSDSTYTPIDNPDVIEIGAVLCIPASQ